MQITKGRMKTPAKVVIYGPEGIGKSTLASRFPAPIFLDVEGGTSRLDVDRVSGIDTLAAFQLAIAELKRDTQGYRTLVIDTADWLEGLIAAKVCADKGKQSLEDFPYKAGYNIVVEEWRRVMDAVGDMQRATGMDVVVCAHSTTRKVQLPGEVTEFDHYELKMLRKSGPILKEWCDFLLFLNYDILVQTDKNGKSFATGGKRCIYTTHTATYDAKSREKMAAKILLDAGGAEAVIATITQGTVAVKPEPQPKPESTDPQMPAPPKEEKPPRGCVETEATAAQKAGPNHEKMYALLQEARITTEEMMAAFAAHGIYPAGTKFEDVPEDRLARTIANFGKFRESIEKARAKK